MKVLQVLAVVVLICGSYATLIIKGPTEPVMWGQDAVLECQYVDSEHNISDVYFQRALKPDGRWFRAYRYRSCIRNGGPGYTRKIGNSRFFDLNYVNLYNDGYYRCVNDKENVTAPENASQVLHLKVHYLRDLHMIKEGDRYPLYRDYVIVQAGDDLVLKCAAHSSEEPTITWTKNGSDWVLPSSTLTLKNITPQDAGPYTCLARHPLYSSLNKNVTINIKMLDWSQRLKAETGDEGTSWYKTSSGELWVTMAAVAVCLLVFVLSISIFLCRRFRKARTSKGPIDDHSQKKPIYKTSVESLPSTCGDSQPLV